MKRLAMIATALVVAGLAGLHAQMPPGSAQMPDPKQMSGLPLPVSDLAPGTLTVRVVKGSMANPIPNQPVELFVGGATPPRTASTNDTGRAEFTGLAAGASVRAVTTVAGERLESQEFQMPSSGGIRLALVATDPEIQKRAADDSRLALGAAQPGMVVLGDQSRFVIEAGDEGLNVFNILQIVNTARTPVQPAAPLVFELPDVAQAPGLLDGSSPLAVLSGKQITINGPFPPGPTIVQFAYTVPFGSGEVTIRQPLPAALNQVTVVAQKVGNLRLESPQLAERRETSANGQAYILGQGPGLKAGDALALRLTGLPHQATWPRNLALALAVVIFAVGAWGAVNTGRGAATAEARVRKLQTKRDRLFAELTTLEEQQRERSIDPERYAARRRELVGSLERVYAEMDEEAAA